MRFIKMMPAFRKKIGFAGPAFELLRVGQPAMTKGIPPDFLRERGFSLSHFSA